ncbi:MAG TPA: DUF1150 domain-containing protein [Beijerinckiaceae bacterium]
MIDETRAARKTPPFTPEQFAHLGDGSIAYVKPLLSEDAARLFPQIGKIQPGLRLFALVGADGSPIMLTDSRDAAIANAWEHELQTVSVH